MVKKIVFYTIEGDGIHVTSPYYSPFIKDARNLGGQWNAAKRVWVFPSFLKENVEKLLIKHYGETGNEPTKPYLITARENICESLGPIRCGRKSICKAWNRDSGAETCAGVYLLDGNISSGGSARYWTTNCSMDSVFRTDYTELQAQLVSNSKKWSIKEITENEERVDETTSCDESTDTS